MHKFLQNKLWRDKMPDIVRVSGSLVHVISLGFYTIGLLKEHTRVNNLYFDSYMMEK